MLHVYVCVFMCIHKGTTECISKVMVTNPYLFFSCCVCPLLSWKSVYGYICAKGPGC